MKQLDAFLGYDVNALIERCSGYEYVFVDLFCGAGGVSNGVEQALGIDGKKIAVVAICVNHDETAIKSHAANFPDAMHMNEDIRTADVSVIKYIVDEIRKRNPNVKICLWASLECTNHSIAKGGMSRDADSRTLADYLFRYFVIKPDVIWIENVKEFLIWGPLKVKEVLVKGCLTCPLEKKTIKKKTKKRPAVVTYGPVWIPIKERKAEDYNRWIAQVKDYGFTMQHRIINCADFGCPTSRKRLFIQFIRPESEIAWPIPTHNKLGTAGKKKWVPVRGCLNLEQEGESIFVPGRITSDDTFRRVTAGILKHSCNKSAAFITKYLSNNAKTGINNGASLDDPCPTVTTQTRLYLVQPQFLVQHYTGNEASKTYSIEQPSRSLTGTAGNHGFVTAKFIDVIYGHGYSKSLDDPAATVRTKDGMSLVGAKFLLNYNHSSHSSSLDVPIPPILTKDHYPIVSVFLDCQYGSGQKSRSVDVPSGSVTPIHKEHLIHAQFIANTNYKNTSTGLDDPLPTITANRKHHYVVNPQWFNMSTGDIDQPSPTVIARQDKSPLSLVCVQIMDEEERKFLAIEVLETDTPAMIQLKYLMAELGIVDIRMRHLEVEELMRITTLDPETYILLGSKTKQKWMIGNAVPSDVVIKLIEAWDRGQVKLAVA